ncbi:MAG: rRNA adenine N-6-methyltransferase family protein [Caldilineales bacterium]
MSNEAVRLGEVLRRHGLRLKKGLGQNFLADPVHLDRIVAAAELAPEDVVLEIGPGAGTLTLRLAQQAGRVVAAELDWRCCRSWPKRWRGNPTSRWCRGHSATRPGIAGERGTLQGRRQSALLHHLGGDTPPADRRPAARTGRADHPTRSRSASSPSRRT